MRDTIAFRHGDTCQTERQNGYVAPMAEVDDFALLARIASDETLLRYFEWPCDFDVTRREPVEHLHLSSGAPLEPVAGCGSGGTYFLIGERGATRPVIYTSSEGQGGLIADSLREALELMAGIPYWMECLHLTPAELARPEVDLLKKLELDFHEDLPEFDPAAQRAAAAALGISPPNPARLLRRLRERVARTRPDYIVHTNDGWPYDSF